MSESPYNPLLDDILDACLDEVLSGRQSLAEILALYPNQAGDLKPLLEMAILTARLKAPAMPDSAVDSLEARLRGEMGGATSRAPIPLDDPQHLPAATGRKPTQRNTLPLGLSRLAAAILVAVLLAVGGGGGLVAASANTVPGDALYSVKRLWEAIILALAQLLGQGDDARARVAQARLTEIEILDERGQLNRGALDELYRSIYELSLHLTPENNGEIVAFMKQVRDALGQVAPSANAQGVYSDLLNLTSTTVANGVVPSLANPLPPSEQGLTIPLTPTPSPTASDTPTATDTATPGPTSTDTMTPSLTPSITPTFTPRIPATPTRTPTYTPSPTLTPTLTPTPTATWTALPLPGAPQITPVATNPPPGRIPTSTPITLPNSGTDFVRETQQSVYMTQTAEAQNP